MYGTDGFQGETGQIGSKVRSNVLGSGFQGTGQMGSKVLDNGFWGTR